MYVSAIALLSVLPSLGLAAPAARAARTVLERRDISHDWVKNTRAPSEAALPVRIALTQRDIHRGHDLLMEISDPDSPKYGQHLSSQEVMDMFAPTEETVNSIRDWLVDSGIDIERHRHNGYHIDFDATVQEMEELLHTKYHVYNHPSGTKHYACDEYSLPHDIHHHVDFIIPTVGHDVHDGLLSKRQNSNGKNPAALPPWQRRVSSSTVQPAVVSGSGTPPDLKHCDGLVTPQCIRALYGIPVGTTNTTGNQLGIFEDGDYYDTNDLNLFLKDFTHVPTGTYPVLHSIDGGIAPVKNEYEGGESSLDLDIATPLIYPQGINLFQTDDRYAFYNHSGIFDTFLDALDASFCTYKGGDSKLDPVYPDPHPHGYKGKLQCGTEKPTNVISISYGLAEFSFPVKYRERQCYEYMKLALQGTTIVFSSGDSGVGSRQGCLDKKAQNFAPQFPASCQYVLAVGATEIKPGNTVYQPEVAVSKNEFDFYSGGGFSNYQPRPSYQDAAVTNYLKIDPPFFPHSKFNASGRAYPDVSANGMNIVTYFGGFTTLNGGTSASAPIWSSVLTLINERRLAAGKSTVGFVNPVLYKNPSALNDIVTGNNPGCDTNGFTCAPGWDPVTGLGTPNFPKLLDVFMALP